MNGDNQDLLHGISKTLIKVLFFRMLSECSLQTKFPCQPVSLRGSVCITGESGTDELDDYEILTSIRDTAVTHTGTLKHVVTRPKRN